MSKDQADTVVEPLSVEERTARGKAARGEVPRSVHAGWEPPPDRRDPVELLEEQAATRVPELVPIRYGRMLVSPFTFFRGAAYPMASDLAGLPRTGLDVQLCGDAHLSNFGGFAAPDRTLVFDVNDFDETLPGPFEWDVKRLVASLAVAGRGRGFDAKQRRSINTAASRSYREAMRRFAEMPNLDVWHARLDVSDISRALGAGRLKEGNEAGPEDGREGAHEGQPACAEEADGARRRRTAHHQRTAADRPVDQALSRGCGRHVGGGCAVPAALLSPHAAGRRPRAAGRLSLRRRRPQGRRRRERRHARAHRAATRARRPGSAVPAGQGSATVRARGLRRQEPLRQPRTARCGGAVADAGRQRRIPRLDSRGRRRDGVQRDFYVRQLWDWKASADIDE